MRHLNKSFLFLLLTSVFSQPILTNEKLIRYVESFIENDIVFHEGESNVPYQYKLIPNSESVDFLDGNIPYFDAPDSNLEKTYYFRWWIWRSHLRYLRDTTNGNYFYTMGGFHPDNPWNDPGFNTTNSSAQFDMYEARWIHNRRYLKSNAKYWLKDTPAKVNNVKYSTWLANSILARHKVDPDTNLLRELFPGILAYYAKWDKKGQSASYRDTDSLYWQSGNYDAMELGIGGNGKRPSFNSYMYGDALAISEIGKILGNSQVQQDYAQRAAKMKSLVQNHLWDNQAKFFKTYKGRVPTGHLVNVREEIGYTPWYFNLPDDNNNYAQAWAQAMDTNGFYAPYGLTTAERRHPQFFTTAYTGHCCKWNGPSWPYSTSITLTALANLLRNYDQNQIDKSDYFDLLSVYSNSHRITVTRNNKKITMPWVGEDLDPLTGVWLARMIRSKGNYNDPNHHFGKHYFHSTFVDLVISGLCGIIPRTDNMVEINPLVEEKNWDYFALDNILYHDKILSIVWDKTGKKYGKHKGLTLYIDGKAVKNSDKIEKIVVDINAPEWLPTKQIFAQKFNWKQNQNAIMLLFPKHHENAVIVTNIKGEQVYSARGKGNLEFQTSRIKSGVYIMKIYGDDNHQLKIKI